MREIKIVDALNEAIREEMLRDENVFCMGEDIGAKGGIFSVTKGLLDEFGAKRVRNTPISENAFTTAAVSMACNGGLRPIVEIMYEDFIGVCWDAIGNQAPKIRYMANGAYEMPIVFRMQGGAGFGEGAQHSQSWENLFCHIPGLIVMMPSTPYDAKGLMKTAIRSNDPVVFIEPCTLYNSKGEVPEEEYLIPIGKADVKREGKDITVVALGQECANALEAAEILAKEGISLEVIDPRTLLPLDFDTVKKSVLKTGRLMVSHVAVKNSGYGAEVAARIVEDKEAFAALKTPVCRVCAVFTPVPYSPVLEKAHFPQVEDIVEAARAMMK